MTLPSVNNPGAHTGRLESKSGPDRKRAAWVDTLNLELQDEMGRLRKLGMKFNLKNLCVIAFDNLKNSQRDAYTRNMFHALSELPLHMKIDVS